MENARPGLPERRVPLWSLTLLPYVLAFSPLLTHPLHLCVRAAHTDLQAVLASVYEDGYARPDKRLQRCQLRPGEPARRASQLLIVARWRILILPGWPGCAGAPAYGRYALAGRGPLLQRINMPGRQLVRPGQGEQTTRSIDPVARFAIVAGYLQFTYDM